MGVPLRTQIWVNMRKYVASTHFLGKCGFQTNLGKEPELKTVYPNQRINEREKVRQEKHIKQTQNKIK